METKSKTILPRTNTTPINVSIILYNLDQTLNRWTHQTLRIKFFFLDGWSTIKESTPTILKIFWVSPKLSYQFTHLGP